MSSALPPWAAQALERLFAARAAGRLPHALLVCGPAGLGKRALAGELVAALLCERPAADGTACGSCRGCTLRQAGTHPDFSRVGLEEIEKTGKLRSEIVIEQVRALSARLALTPQFGGAQVVLLDPAERMNTSAANALLKTLEEPHPGCLLLLMADQPFALPATIRSRCQRVELRMPGRADALAWLGTQGADGEMARVALEAARGNPGAALELLREGGMQRLREVRADLEALALGRSSAAEAARRWCDEHLEQRLRFAADTVRDAALRDLVAGLTPSRDFPKLAAWFDRANRLRELVRTTVRTDLMLVGLLREWRRAGQSPRST